MKEEILPHQENTNAGKRTMSTDEGEFDVSRAELFEAIGHHTRLTILQSLEERPMTFSELKRKVGIESSGLLSFHLGKLTHLVSTNQEGTYVLTDQGKEAVRMIHFTRSAGNDGHAIKVKVSSSDKRPYLVVISVLLAAVILLGSVAVYQQGQLSGLSSTISHDPVLVYGTFATSWATGMTATSTSSQIVFSSSSGVNTTVIPNAGGQYTVSLSGGQNYTITVYWRSNLSCSTACWPIISAPPTINATVGHCPASGCPTQHLSGAYGTVDAMSATSTQAIASGTCFGQSLDLHSTTGSYQYNPSC
jgi:DNA-binding HxlR family transcriptional regulator